MIFLIFIFIIFNNYIDYIKKIPIKKSMFLYYW